ncbi:hypothetical protein [Actinomadura rubrisoli]|uniref:Uncharacterized protein n=1 Tax=Actinomadura rubrisoli TaxID=2530368 RepID=A0A4R5CJX3_9ACTN|nr:hypothetical protein [Actinomadura rubrisoli]TDD97722.1 hypothetical protein E1298_01410 [Actinomadura rubrisoli]
MASLLIIRRGADIVGQCDAVCYDATQPECVCKACMGRNHGVGLEQAIVNTRALVAEWDQRGDVYELDDAVQHTPLFPLPQEHA